MFPSWSRADVPNEPFSCPDAISTDTDHPLVNHHSFISPINSPPRLILAFNFKTGVEPFGKNWKFIEGGEEREYGGISYIESAKQTRYSNRFASICTNASSLIFLFLLFLFFPSLERERERGEHDWNTRYVFLYGDRFSIRWERRAPHYRWWRACGIILGKDFVEDYGWKWKICIEIGFNGERNPTFRNFVFPPNRALIPPSSSSFFSLESFGSKVGNESCLDRFFFFSMHKTSSDYNEASYSELFFSGKGRIRPYRSYRALLISILPFQSSLQYEFRITKLLNNIPSRTLSNVNTFVERKYVVSKLFLKKVFSRGYFWTVHQQGIITS